MHRFFLTQNFSDQESFILTDAKEIHHLKNVLRLKPKQQLKVFNNEGKEVVGTITTITKDRIEIRRDYVIPSKRNRPIDLILACAVPKRSKFEFIIEKCTELGVDEIIPLKTQRTEIILNSERLEKKNHRYETVAVNAAKQSGRQVVPKIHPVSPIADVLKLLKKDSLALIACLSDGENILSLLNNQDLKKFKRIIFFIGPEGDFSKEEVTLARKTGCLGVSLGPTVLKVDTAAISVVSFANLYFDYAFNRN